MIIHFRRQQGGILVGPYRPGKLMEDGRVKYLAFGMALTLTLRPAEIVSPPAYYTLTEPVVAYLLKETTYDFDLVTLGNIWVAIHEWLDTPREDAACLVAIRLEKAIDQHFYKH